MCASDRVLPPLLALVVACASACDDPTRTLVPPESPAELVLVGALDSGSDVQRIMVQALGLGLPELPVTARLLHEGTVVAEGSVDNPGDGDLSDCVGVYGQSAVEGGYCLLLSYLPLPGEEYELRVNAPDRKEAWARATALEPFEMEVDLDYTGDRPSHVDASWTESAGAYRYVLTVRSVDPVSSPSQSGWLAQVTDTRFSGPIDPASLREGRHPWTVELQAMDRAFYDFLTTGATGSLFTVPPRQNVVDGRGVFGSRAFAQQVPDATSGFAHSPHLSSHSRKRP